MTVSELIVLLEFALLEVPQDPPVCVSDEREGSENDRYNVRGIILRDGIIDLCMDEDCPGGIKDTCFVCHRGCRYVWFVQKSDGSAYIEQDELRGPNDRKNLFEFVDARNTGKWIGENEPLPKY